MACLLALVIPTVVLVIPAMALAAPEALDVLVMIVDFEDVPAPPQLRFKEAGSFTNVPLDIPNAEAVFFTNAASTAARCAEMSNGELSVTGEVIAVSIDLMLASSTAPQWRAAADLAAVAQGYDLSDYNRFAYLLSSGFSGQFGTGAAMGNWFWAAGAAGDRVSEGTFNHELGHTVGFQHASEIQPDGTVSEYGDATDFMGSGEAVHTNAVNKERKGWLTGERHRQHELDSSAVYLLQPLADSLDGLQMVSIDGHGAHPDLGVPIEIYVSFRVPIGFDQNLSNADDAHGTPLRDTVHVHYARRGNVGRTYLDRALEMGDVHATQLTTIEVLNISSAGASISVSQDAYHPLPPVVSVEALETDSALAGATLEYSATVTNPDTEVSFPVFYESAFVSPGEDWIVAWDTVPKAILLGPGETEEIRTIRVISPFGTLPGVYGIHLLLTNETGSSGPVSTTASFLYEVLPPVDTTPPPPPSSLVGTPFEGSGDDYVVLTWTPPLDTSDVIVYRVYRNGVALETLAFAPVLPDYSYDSQATNAYVVHSVDAAANESTRSNTFVIGAPDDEAPSPVATLLGEVVMGRVVLSWGAATDDTWVETYEIYRNGEFYAVVEGTSFSDETPTQGYPSYIVRAVDASGNASLASEAWQPATPVPLAGSSGALAVGATLLLSAMRKQRDRSAPR